MFIDVNGFVIDYNKLVSSNYKVYPRRITPQLEATIKNILKNISRQKISCKDFLNYVIDNIQKNKRRYPRFNEYLNFSKNDLSKVVKRSALEPDKTASIIQLVQISESLISCYVQRSFTVYEAVEALAGLDKLDPYTLCYYNFFAYVEVEITEQWNKDPILRDHVKTILGEYHGK